MRALICNEFGPIDTLQVMDMPVPTPGAGQIRISVRAAAVNFPDALVVQGRYQVKPVRPFSPGSELAGVVSALGDGVQGVAVGDAVIATTPHGAMAEECVVEAGRVIPLWPGMGFDIGAAMMLTYGTSLHALADCGRLQAGETLLVLGAAGGVGLAAIEIGKAMGARVIAAASSTERLVLCRDAGADEVIDYAAEDLRTRLDELAGKGGIDVVYDPVGGACTETAFRALAWGGRLLVVGFAAGDIPRLPLNLALLAERSVIGVYWGEWARRHPQLQKANQARLAAWFAEGRVRPRVTERVSLEGAADAIARMADRKVMGKVVVMPV